MSKYVVIGTGYPVKEYVQELYQLKREGWKLLAFQESFPHCLSLGLTPKYWTWADPNASIPGLEVLLKNPSSKNMPSVIIPDFLGKPMEICRTYMGTSPLARREGAWDDYLSMLKAVSPTLVSATTTKRLKNHPYSEYSLRKLDLLNGDAKTRFAYHKMICGSVPFDSEEVSGTKYLWGLESKLSSHVLPLLYYMGAKEVIICGFGMKGARFFSDETRMPFNDATQSNSAHTIPLDIIKKWMVDWLPLHQMHIATLESPEHGYLHEVMSVAVLNG